MLSHVSDVTFKTPEVLQKLISLLSTRKGFRTIEDALWDLVVRTDGELNRNSVFVSKDDTGYYADVGKPSRGIVINSFASPF